jgi:phosphodiesterase/alkaline phosphatase D-like protein
MKNSLRTIALAFAAGYVIQTTCADAGVSFFGVAAGDATNDNVIVWTRAKDESNPQPTTINVQVSDDPTFSTGVTMLPAGTADSATDFTVKLLAAQQGQPTWKFINISDPIDQIGPIGGSLVLNNAPTPAEYGTLGNITSIITTADSNGSGNKTVTVATTVGLVVGQPVSGTNVVADTKIASISTDGTTFTISNSPTPSAIPTGTTLTLSGAASTYSPVTNDGGKSWMGGYRAERNALLKFIADNHIRTSCSSLLTIIRTASTNLSTRLPARRVSRQAT